MVWSPWSRAGAGIAAALCVAGVAGSASAQRLHVKRYGIDEGLPAAQVFTGHQDAQGFMWFGTPTGAVRYDGDRFVHYTVDDGLVHDSVRSFAEHDGVMWLAGEKGVTALEPGRPRQLTEADGLAEGLMWRAVVHDGALWFGASGGLSRWDGQLTTFTTAEGLPSNNVFALYPDGDVLWLGTRGGGLARFRNDRIEKVPIAAEQVMAVTRLGDTLWVGSRDAGIFRSDGDGFKQVVADAPVYSVGRRGDELFWGTLGQGVLRMAADGSIRRIGVDEGLGGDRIYDVVVDREGSVWFTTNAGVSKLLSDAFEGYLVDKNVLTLARHDGAVFAGTLGGGMWQIGSGERQSRHYAEVRQGEEVASLDTVWSLTPQGERLWLGTAAGLAELVAGEVIAHPLEGPPEDGIYDILVVDDALWLAGIGGVCRHVPGSGRCEVIEGFPSPVSYCGVQHEGRLCFATEAGVGCLRGDEVQIYGRAEGLPSETVYTVAVHQGRLVAGTNRGLARLEGDRFAVWDVGLPHKFVGALAELDRDTLAVGTTHGVSLVRAGRVQRTLDKRSGLLGNETNFDSLLAAEGELWIGTTTGLSRYRSDRERANQTPPPVVLVSWAVDGIIHQDTTASRLPPDSQALVFRFAALSFRDEDDVRFSYRLEGYEDSWSEPTADRRTRYTNLAPGSYRFLVKAQNGDGVWSEPTPLASFVVATPYWRSWWFRGLVTLFGCAAIYLLYRLRLSMVRRKTAELERVVAERTEQLTEANEKLRELSLTDPLTKLKNRRYLKELLPVDVARSRRAQRDSQSERFGNLGFILVDIDHFKRVNDTHGHEAGDELLCAIATRVREAVRESDAVIRWGGEEFLVVCRDVDRTAINELAERIGDRVRTTEFSLPDGAAIEATCSVGFSLFPFSLSQPDDFSYEEVIAFADRAMYIAKANGRDMVVGIVGTDRSCEAAERSRIREDLAGSLAAGLVRIVAPRAPADLELTA